MSQSIIDPRSASVVETPLFAGVAGALKRLVEGLDRDAERPRLPPVLAARDLAPTNYFKNFPHLLGLVCCFHGDEAAHRHALAAQARGEAWSKDFSSAGMALTPAACLPVYPWAARNAGATPSRVIYVCSWCYRHEPSAEPGRLQSFEMAEYVKIAGAAEAIAFRDGWMDRARDLARDLRLEVEIAPANDPFFGRAAGVMSKGQREAGLKFELRAALARDLPAAACMSFNAHQDHFGKGFGLEVDGGPAHTACVGFGIDRLALALFHRHGAELKGWPAPVLDLLQLSLRAGG